MATTIPEKDREKWINEAVGIHGKGNREMTSDDPMELIIADGLKRAAIRFVHESDNRSQNLDFWLPDSGVYIECKQFPTDRTSAQIAPYSDVIVIQGRTAAHLFASMITAPQPS